MANNNPLRDSILIATSFAALIWGLKFFEFVLGVDLYNLGVYPAWWKLESQTTQAWQNISEVIEYYDPMCHGVLLLGLDAPEEQLRESFRVAAPFPVCKGFAVGRSIFGEAARKWFSGEMEDRDVIDQIARNYQHLIEFWHEAQEGVLRDGKHSAIA